MKEERYAEDVDRSRGMTDPVDRLRALARTSGLRSIQDPRFEHTGE